MHVVLLWYHFGVNETCARQYLKEHKTCAGCDKPLSKPRKHAQNVVNGGQSTIRIYHQCKETTSFFYLVLLLHLVFAT